VNLIIKGDEVELAHLTCIPEFEWPNSPKNTPFLPTESFEEFLSAFFLPFFSLFVPFPAGVLLAIGPFLHAHKWGGPHQSTVVGKKIMPHGV
jgi:hypothetical protein